MANHNSNIHQPDPDPSDQSGASFVSPSNLETGAESGAEGPSVMDSGTGHDPAHDQAGSSGKRGNFDKLIIFGGAIFVVVVVAFYTLRIMSQPKHPPVAHPQTSAHSQLSPAALAMQKKLEAEALEAKAKTSTPSVPASVQPASVQPASVQPASVQPASVQPASVQTSVHPAAPGQIPEAPAAAPLASAEHAPVPGLAPAPGLAPTPGLVPEATQPKLVFSPTGAPIPAPATSASHPLAQVPAHSGTVVAAPPPAPLASAPVPPASLLATIHAAPAHNPADLPPAPLTSASSAPGPAVTAPSPPLATAPAVSPAPAPVSMPVVGSATDAALAQALDKLSGQVAALSAQLATLDHSGLAPAKTKAKDQVKNNSEDNSEKNSDSKSGKSEKSHSKPVRHSRHYRARNSITLVPVAKADTGSSSNQEPVSAEPAAASSSAPAWDKTQPVTYTVSAVLDGRAWLKASDGTFISVVVGSKLPDGAQVSAITGSDVFVNGKKLSY